MEQAVSIEMISPDFITALVLKTYTPLLTNPVHAKRFEDWNTLHIPSYIAATATVAYSLELDPEAFTEEDIATVFDNYAQMVEVSVAMVEGVLLAESEGHDVINFYNNDEDAVKKEIMKGLSYLYYRNVPDMGGHAVKQNFDNVDMEFTEAVYQPLFFYSIPMEFLHAFLNAINDVIKRTNVYLNTVDEAQKAKIRAMPFNKAGVASIASLNNYLEIIVNLGDISFFTNPALMDGLNNNETIEILSTETEAIIASPTDPSTVETTSCANATDGTVG